MKPIPTPEKIFINWNIVKPSGCQSPLHAITFAHQTLAPMIEEASNAQQPEPIGEGHRLLIHGKDTWQDGDEYFDSTAKQWKPTLLSACNAVKNIDTASIGRRPLRNPWRLIKDAPPEHMEQQAFVIGGQTIAHVGFTVLRKCASDRTHYLIESDLPPVPPVPQEAAKDDGFDAWWKDNRILLCNEDHARIIWRARGKEKP